jgi:hypothetical protein
LANTIQDYQPYQPAVLAQDWESAQTLVMREARAQRMIFSFQPPDQLTTPQSYRTAYRRCRQSTSIDQQPVEIADRNQHYGPVLVG